MGSGTRPSSATDASTYIIGDRYQLLECIGKGAHGRVYRGHDTKTSEHVAVKEVSLERLRQSDITSIMGEVELLKSLNHRNVVQYLGSFQTRQYLYIIMELVEAGSLATMVRRGTLGPFPEALIGFFVDQVLQGLAYLHSMGITHRDIKGANILTNSEGLVKLADFGVAAKLEVGEVEERETGGGTQDGRVVKFEHDQDENVAGTPYWMAPEVVELQDVTVSSDIWSVGCVVIELLTGRPPYFDLQPLSAMYNIVQDPHPPLPAGVSEQLEDFLLQCFAKDPTKRPSAKDLTKHAWIVDSRRTMKSVWADSSSEFDADIASVIERLLASDLASSPSKNVRRRCGGKVREGDCDGGFDGETAPQEDSKAAPSEPISSELVKTESNIAFLRAVDEDPTGSDALQALALSGTTLDDDQRHGVDATDLLRQVESLRGVATSKERSLVQEAAAAASARAIDGYVSNDASLAQTFYRADGLSCIREIMDAPSERLVAPCFDLLLTLVDADVVIMEHVCSLGVVPAAMRFALRSFSLDMRRRAAELARLLVRGSPYSATMFVAGQGIPFVMALMDGDSDNLELTCAAVSIFWTILRRTLHGGAAGTAVWPNQYLRLMAHHDLPCKLTDAVARALDWIGQAGDGSDDDNDSLAFLEATVNLFAAMCQGDKIVRTRCALVSDRLLALVTKLPTTTSRTLTTALKSLSESI